MILPLKTTLYLILSLKITYTWMWLLQKDSPVLGLPNDKTRLCLTRVRPNPIPTANSSPILGSQFQIPGFCSATVTALWPRASGFPFLSPQSERSGQDGPSLTTRGLVLNQGLGGTKIRSRNLSLVLTKEQKKAMGLIHLPKHQRFHLPGKCRLQKE